MISKNGVNKKKDSSDNSSTFVLVCIALVLVLLMGWGVMGWRVYSFTHRDSDDSVSDRADKSMSDIKNDRDEYRDSIKKFMELPKLSVPGSREEARKSLESYGEVKESFWQDGSWVVSVSKTRQDNAKCLVWLNFNDGSNSILHSGLSMNYLRLKDADKEKDPVFKDNYYCSYSGDYSNDSGVPVSANYLMNPRAQKIIDWNTSVSNAAQGLSVSLKKAPNGIGWEQRVRDYFKDSLVQVDRVTSENVGENVLGIRVFFKNVPLLPVLDERQEQLGNGYWEQSKQMRNMPYIGLVGYFAYSKDSKFVPMLKDSVPFPDYRERSRLIPGDSPSSVLPPRSYPYAPLPGDPGSGSSPLVPMPGW